MNSLHCDIFITILYIAKLKLVRRNFILLASRFVYYSLTSICSLPLFSCCKYFVWMLFFTIKFLISFASLETLLPSRRTPWVISASIKWVTSNQDPLNKSFLFTGRYMSTNIELTLPFSKASAILFKSGNAEPVGGKLVVTICTKINQTLLQHKPSLTDFYLVSELFNRHLVFWRVSNHCNL